MCLQKSIGDFSGPWTPQGFVVQKVIRDPCSLTNRLGILSVSCNIHKTYTRVRDHTYFAFLFFKVHLYRQQKHYYINVLYFYYYQFFSLFSVCNFLIHDKCIKTLCNPCVGVAATLVKVSPHHIYLYLQIGVL
jgi:hypothetical protein